MAKEVMNTHDIIFSNRPYVLAADVITYGSKGMTFSPQGTYWRQMRKICTMELLAPKHVDSFRSIREQELTIFVKEISLSEGSPINHSEKISSLAYVLISRIAFGIKSKDQQAYREFMKGVTDTGLVLRRSIDHGMDRILENIVRDHREKNLDTKAVGEENGEDLVDVLLRLQRNGDHQHPMSDCCQSNDIFSAGSDTSSTIMIWVMSELVKNPRVMEKVQIEVRRVFDRKGYVDETSIQEVKYLRSVI
uniref:Cytochrome P450 n=2 Tax=Glycine subgen. Soja TaxID=1462606 RepID=A0A0R0G7V8_SOYBN